MTSGYQKEGPPAYANVGQPNAAPVQYVQQGQQQPVQYVQQGQQQQPVQYVQQQGQPQQVQYVVQQQGQPMQQGQQVVMVHQPVATHQVVVHQRPMQFPTRSTVALCPKCNQNVQTRVHSEPGLGTWLVCGGLCLAGCWLGCCFIPFCVEDLQDAHHSCPTCGTHMGSRKLLQ